MAALMQQRDFPTGILTFKTYMALDAIAWLKQTYPERLNTIEFVGFGNLPLLTYLTHKPVASIDENPVQMGQEAMNLLLRLMTDGLNVSSQIGTRIGVRGELVVHAQ